MLELRFVQRKWWLNLKFAGDLNTKHFKVPGHPARRESWSIRGIVVPVWWASYGSHLERRRKDSGMLRMGWTWIPPKDWLDTDSLWAARGDPRFRLWLEAIPRGGAVWCQGVDPGARRSPQRKYLTSCPHSRRKGNSRKGTIWNLRVVLVFSAKQSTQ